MFLYNGRDDVVTDANGLFYMRARYYSPQLKRFINADVLVGNINKSTTLNRYAYAEGNPISYIDPFGLSAEPGSNWVSNLLSDVTAHDVLDLLGTVAVVGMVADGINFLWYLAEGDMLNASFSAMSFVPVVGDAFGAGKLVVKNFDEGCEIIVKGGQKLFSKADNFSKVDEVAEAVQDVVKGSNNVLLETDEVIGTIQNVSNNKYWGIGKYEDVKGHHIHAKAAFKGDINYDPNKGFSISQSFMDANGINHQKRHQSKENYLKNCMKVVERIH